MKPGAYVITAAPATGNVDEWGPIATQWFIVSDLGLTTLSGNDGVHAIVRSLSSAEPVAGAKLRLIAVNNDVLGEAVTDADGYGRFEPGLARGTGGMAPQLVVAETGDDYAFIDLTRAAFDLTDRGVDGRPAPGALDVFLTPERGIYRPGETVHLTALVRDARANAVGDLPMTLVVERPDGVEFLRADALRRRPRRLLRRRRAAGRTPCAARGGSSSTPTRRARRSPRPRCWSRISSRSGWRSTVDTTATVLDRDDADARSTSRRAISTARRRPASSVEGEVDPEADRHARGLPRLQLRPRRRQRRADARAARRSTRVTDEDGKATFEVTLPEPAVLDQAVRGDADHPRRRHQRPRRRAHDRPAGRGRRPDDRHQAALRRRRRGRRHRRASTRSSSRRTERACAKAGVPWKLERIETDYQWYRSNGTWNYELITNAAARRRRHGRLHRRPAGARSRRRSNWGRYRLTVETTTATARPRPASSSTPAGTARSSSSDTPDTLQVALDKPAYAIGETAKLRLDPRFAGIALIIGHRRPADRDEGGRRAGRRHDGRPRRSPRNGGPAPTSPPTLYRPMDIEAKRMPARALGLDLGQGRARRPRPRRVARRCRTRCGRAGR